MTITAITPFAQAASAYASGSVASLSAPSAGGTDFADMVGQAASAALGGLHRAEAVTASGVAGKTDVQAVVQAMSSAELTMQSVVAVRDKVVGAYSDIMRMSV